MLGGIAWLTQSVMGHIGLSDWSDATGIAPLAVAVSLVHSGLCVVSALLHCSGGAGPLPTSNVRPHPGARLRAANTSVCISGAYDDSVAAPMAIG